MAQQFQDEIDEAPYVARLRAVISSNSGFPGHGPSQIMDYLYLGNMGEAKDIQHLKELGITHVINCAAGYIPTGENFYKKHGIDYTEFWAEDDDNYNMMQHFEEVQKVIENIRASKRKVLVHCIMGINRSGLMVTTHCMLAKKIGPISAAKFVLKSRTGVLSNMGFQYQLISFSREKGLLHLDRNDL